MKPDCMISYAFGTSLWEQLEKGLRHMVEKLCTIFCCEFRRSEAYRNEANDGNKDVWNQPTTQIFSDKEVIYVLSIS